MDKSQRAELQPARETRSMAFQDVEIREKPDGTGGTTLEFNGYGSVTDTPYEMHDMFGAYTEIVRRGAFAKTIADGCDTAFLLNHEGLTMARTKSGTLRLAEDSVGLHANADLDTSRADVQALRSGIARGDIDEMSFAFRTIRQEWSPDYDQRDLIELSLDKGDVSAVNYGANPHTSDAGVSLRKDAHEMGLSDEEITARLEFSHDELRYFVECELTKLAAASPAPVGPSDLHLARAHALRLRASRK
jgi:hypothetical protein